MKIVVIQDTNTPTAHDKPVRITGDRQSCLVCMNDQFASVCYVAYCVAVSAAIFVFAKNRAKFGVFQYQVAQTNFGKFLAV